jgi:hypothetical protein
VCRLGREVRPGTPTGGPDAHGGARAGLSVPETAVTVAGGLLAADARIRTRSHAACRRPPAGPRSARAADDASQSRDGVGRARRSPPRRRTLTGQPGHLEQLCAAGSTSGDARATCPGARRDCTLTEARAIFSGERAPPAVSGTNPEPSMKKASAAGDSRAGRLAKPADLQGTLSEPMKGLEPSTFCSSRQYLADWISGPKTADLQEL